MSNDRQSDLGSSIITFKGSSGSIARLPDKKRSKDENKPEEKEKKDDNDQNAAKSEYVDRSAQLRATLNSLALLNVGNIKKSKRKNSENSDNNILDHNEKT